MIASMSLPPWVAGGAYPASPGSSGCLRNPTLLSPFVCVIFRTLPFPSSPVVGGVDGNNRNRERDRRRSPRDGFPPVSTEARMRLRKFLIAACLVALVGAG